MNDENNNRESGPVVVHLATFDHPEVDAPDDKAWGDALLQQALFIVNDNVDRFERWHANLLPRDQLALSNAVDRFIDVMKAFAVTESEARLLDGNR